MYTSGKESEKYISSRNGILYHPSFQLHPSNGDLTAYPFILPLLIPQVQEWDVQEAGNAILQRSSCNILLHIRRQIAKKTEGDVAADIFLFSPLSHISKFIKYLLVTFRVLAFITCSLLDYV